MRLVMMGTGTFAQPTFEALFGLPHQVVGLFTQPEREVGHERGSTRLADPAMKELALARGVPVFQPNRVNEPEGIEALQSLQPDLLVVAAYGQILSGEVLGVSARGGINVHASLLPRYRGAAPIAWAIYQGENQTGVTIIRMSTGLDAGDMLAQETVDISPDETAGELEARLAPLGATLATQVIEQIATGVAKGKTQDKSLVTKAPKLTKEHGQIEWTRTAPQVCCQIRAMHPWPTAYTWLHRQGQAPARLIVHKACVQFETGVAAGPGSILAETGNLDSLVVATGAGAVKILELQPAGKRRMSAADYLRGYRPRSGDRLGAEK